MQRLHSCSELPRPTPMEMLNSYFMSLTLGLGIGHLVSGELCLTL